MILILYVNVAEGLSRNESKCKSYEKKCNSCIRLVVFSMQIASLLLPIFCQIMAGIDLGEWESMSTKDRRRIIKTNCCPDALTNPIQSPHPVQHGDGGKDADLSPHQVADSRIPSGTCQENALVPSVCGDAPINGDAV